MSWSETTVINPEAWSQKVEDDLGAGLGLVERDSFIGEVTSRDPAWEAACGQARKKLQSSSGVQVVSLGGQGVTVEERGDV